MKMKLAALAAMALAGLALAGCAKGKQRQLQGWVEAETDLRVARRAGPHRNPESARGRPGQKGELLFTVDDDLQKADVVVKKTTLINAQQTFDRAKQLY